MTFLGFPLTNGFRSMTPKGFYDPIKGHTGLDFLMPVGTNISLPFDVTVVDFLVQKEMGNTLYLKDGENIIVLAHLSEVYVKVGTTVNKHFVFARSGNTGTATTAPHLHVEVIAPKPQEGFEMMTRTLGKYSGYNIDPTNYLEPRELTDLEWCKKYLPEADWTKIPLEMTSAFRALAKRVEWRK